MAGPTEQTCSPECAHPCVWDGRHWFLKLGDAQHGGDWLKHCPSCGARLLEGGCDTVDEISKARGARVDSLDALSDGACEKCRGSGHLRATENGQPEVRPCRCAGGDEG